MTNVLTQEVKEKYIQRASKHKEADAFIQGVYWKEEQGEFKGCAVGCLAETDQSPHEALAKDMHLPLWLFYLADRAFEGLPSPDFKEWPLRFVSSLPVGLAEDQIKVRILHPFLVHVLEQALTSFDHEQFPDCKAVVDQVIELYKSGNTDTDNFKNAASAADAADASASAAYAARAAARTARAAARTARAAARAADAGARAADAADADASARTAYAADAWKDFANKLIELMENANND